VRSLLEKKNNPRLRVRAEVTPLSLACMRHGHTQSTGFP
jgi:hypothetical protein